MGEPLKYLLPESEIPTHWVNLLADLGPPPRPPLHPGTKEPLGPEDLAPIFPMALIEQEVSAEPEIEIPDEVREIYKLWRPTPLHRARRLERALDTPAHIYYKYEGVSPAGSHKPNTAVAQAYFNKREGVHKLATETGAGQWGSALALACQLFDLECEVFMVGVCYDQKPYRRAMIETWGATVHRSPSELTEAGRSQAEHSIGQPRDRDLRGGRGGGEGRGHQLLARLGAQPRLPAPDGDRPGGDRPARAGRRVPGRGGRLRRRRLELRRGSPTRSSAGDLREGLETRFVAAEPAACPTLTRGVYRYDFGDTVGLTPLMPMYTLGHDFVPPPVHAGGLRYHGDAPSLCALVKEGVVEARAIAQTAAFDAAVALRRKPRGSSPRPSPRTRCGRSSTRPRRPGRPARSG